MTVYVVWCLVQASVPSNTYVISGHIETKSIQSLMPGILTQLSQEMLNQAAGSMQQGGGVGGAIPEEEEEEDADDDDIPELVENFEDVSKK